MFNFYKKYFKLTLVILYTLHVTGCSSAQQTDIVNCGDYVKHVIVTKQYKNDSALLSYTTYRWIDSSYGWFGHYNRRNAITGFYRVHVGDIFYDSARLKLTAFVFIEYSTDYIDTLYERVSDLKSHFFDSHTVMGYRDSLNQSWKLFELQELFVGLRGISLKSSKDVHENIFLNKREMAARKISIYDDKTGLNTKYEPVKYVPCEDEYWTQSPLWKKGNRVPGYYIFETFMNATPLKKDLRPVFKINYPDSLLSFYK